MMFKRVIRWHLRLIKEGLKQECPAKASDGKSIRKNSLSRISLLLKKLKGRKDWTMWGWVRLVTSGRLGHTGRDRFCRTHKSSLE